MKPTMWKHFRRLLLGTVVEVLRDQGVQVDLPTMQLAFDDSVSAFRFPAFDNYMRFAGHVDVRVLAPIIDEVQLHKRLLEVWPEIVASVHFPLLDTLEVTQNQVHVTQAKGVLHVRFDLIAD